VVGLLVLVVFRLEAGLAVLMVVLAVGCAVVYDGFMVG